MALHLPQRLLLIAAPAVLLVLAACGDESGETSPPATTAVAEPPAVTATPTPVEIPAPVTPEPTVPPVVTAPTPAAVGAPAPGTPEATVTPVTPALEPRTAETPAAPGAPGATPAPAAPLPEGVYVGTAEAIEGDVIRIGTTRILLYGIDTVEPPQVCEIDRQDWECWPAVVRQLQTFLSEGPVTCTAVRPSDPFGRVLSLCEQGGESLNERMVRSGFAVAVPDEMPEYVAIEAEARAERIGLWQGTFQLPDEWRADRGITTRRP